MAKTEEADFLPLDFVDVKSNHQSYRSAAKSKAETVISEIEEDYNTADFKNDNDGDSASDADPNATVEMKFLDLAFRISSLNKVIQTGFNLDDQTV